MFSFHIRHVWVQAGLLIYISDRLVLAWLNAILTCAHTGHTAKQTHCLATLTAVPAARIDLKFPFFPHFSQALSWERCSPEWRRVAQSRPKMTSAQNPTPDTASVAFLYLQAEAPAASRRYVVWIMPMSVGECWQAIEWPRKGKIRINDAESPPPTGKTEPLFCIFSMTASSNSQRHVYQ